MTPVVIMGSLDLGEASPEHLPSYVGWAVSEGVVEPGDAST